MMNGTPPRDRKPLPSRPSQDNGYNRAPNGYTNDGPREYGASPTMASRKPMPDLNGKTVLEGYRQDIMTGFEEEKPRYNPLNVSRPQSSMLLNVKDEIQVHLLVETALGDSKEYEVLSQEEVDDLKRHVQALSSRIDQARSNLAIQSKYRDAAISMARLYSSNRTSGEGDGKKQRRSLLGHNRTPSHEVREAEQERQASERRCEELASELWSLEKRLMVPQNRLLKHTAGILQMTYKGATTPNSSKGLQQAVDPGSPESMYTYQNSRNSMELIGEENFFDERSLYRNADALWEDTTKDTVLQGSQGPSKEQMQMIASTEAKLEDLNTRLREILLKTNPQRTVPFPPRNDLNGGESLQSHLEYLDNNISTLDREYYELGQEHQQLTDMHQQLTDQYNGLSGTHKDLLKVHDNSQKAFAELQQGHDDLKRGHDDLKKGNEDLQRGQQESGAALGSMEQTETVMMGLWDIIHSGEEETRQRKLERRQTRTAQNLPDDDSSDEESDPNQPFSLQAFSTKVQWLYTQATRLKDQKKVLQRQIKQQRELNSKSDATKDAEMEQKVEELSRTTALLARTEADADAVREQMADLLEELEASRQQEASRAQSRSNDESAAVRQIQEELNQRISKTAQLEEELQDLRDDNSIANAEMQVKIGDAENKVSNLTKELAAAAAATATFDALVREKEQQIRDVEQRIQGKQQEIAQRDQELAMKTQALQSQNQELVAKDQALAANTQALKAKEQELKDKDLKFSKTEQELEEMNMEVANLKTEVTIARAELDGAYGSRAQRAAEGAINPAIQNELSELQLKNINLSAEIAQLRDKASSGSGNDERMKTLQSELAETIEEYEQMTKASIEWEKERELLEGTIDKLRDEREGLEAQLSDEKVRWLGMRSPGPDGGTPGGSMGNTSTTVLKNEFKKMMRDTRAESSKALRNEQDQRRRLEDELRALKKQHGPGKSGLSQSYGSS